MSDFLSYIADRLLLEEKVTLPGFGRFILAAIPAKWNPSEDKIYPPIRQIEFERSKENGDNSFLHYAAEKERIGVEEAISRWNEQVSTAKKELGEGKTVEVPGVGTLKNEPESGWIFIPYPTPGGAEEPVQASLVRRDTPKMPPAGEDQLLPASVDNVYSDAPEDRPARRPWRMAGLAAAGVILLIMLFFIVLHYITGGKKSPIPPGDTPPERATAIVKQDTATAPPVSQPMAPQNDSIHYQVIFATYHHADLAEKQLKKLQSWGHEVVLLRNDSVSLFHLAVPFYTLPGDTAAELEKLKKIYGRQAHIQYPSSR